MLNMMDHIYNISFLIKQDILNLNINQHIFHLELIILCLNMQCNYYYLDHYRLNKSHYNINIHFLLFHGKSYPYIQEHIYFKIKLKGDYNLNNYFPLLQSRNYMIYHTSHITHWIRMIHLDKHHNNDYYRKIILLYKQHNYHKYIYKHIEV
jgi:hypothetical protein